MTTLSQFYFIPLCLISNFLVCWIATKFNQSGFLQIWAFTALANLIPSWAMAAYFSRNLIFTATLYDFLLVTSSILYFWIFGQAGQFTMINYIGILLCVIGLVLIKGF